MRENERASLSAAASRTRGGVEAELLRQMLAGMDEAHEETAVWDCTVGDGLDDGDAW